MEKVSGVKFPTERQNFYNKIKKFNAAMKLKQTNMIMGWSVEWFEMASLPSEIIAHRYEEEWYASVLHLENVFLLPTMVAWKSR